MEYYVHNKPNYKMYFILSVLPLYVGYCLGKLYGGRIGIDNFTAVIIRALLTPFPVRFTKVTGPAIAVSMLVYMMICLYHISTVHAQDFPLLLMACLSNSGFLKPAPEGACRIIHQGS